MAVMRFLLPLRATKEQKENDDDDDTNIRDITSNMRMKSSGMILKRTRNLKTSSAYYYKSSRPRSNNKASKLLITSMVIGIVCLIMLGEEGGDNNNFFEFFFGQQGTTTDRGLTSSVNVIAEEDETTTGGSFETKTNEDYNNYDAKQQQQQQQLNILTLGGSVTWGAGLTNPLKESYPKLFQTMDGHNVTNLAIRGTGADYPTRCICSMIRDHHHHQLANTADENDNNNNNNYDNHDDDDDDNHDPEIHYDVIIFEFSINGFDGFELLLKRLQDRFPDALLIYIDLWSLKNGAIDSTNVRQLVNDVGGYVYHLGNFDYENPTTPFDWKIGTPPQEIVDLFGSDQHHLNSVGHVLVYNQVKNIMEQFKKNKIDNTGSGPTRKRLGSWHGGDVCDSWYQTGRMGRSLTIIEGGQMNEWNQDSNKFAIETTTTTNDEYELKNLNSRLVLEYTHHNEHEACIHLQFMTKTMDPSNPLTSLYPPVMIIVQDTLMTDDETEKISTSYDVRLNPSSPIDIKLSLKDDSTGASDGALVTPFVLLPEGWVFEDGYHKWRNMRRFHITDLVNAGIVKPGKNLIHIYPLDKRENPFRVTATIVCEACGELGRIDF